MLDGGEAAIRPVDIDSAARTDLGQAAVVEVVQAQFAAEHPEFGGEIDAADPRADDRDGRICH
jgi:hypothetical protein